MKMKKYKDAIDLFKSKINSGKGTVNDYYSIGRAYYYSKRFINADSSFSKIVAAQPDLRALGYLWKAKANVQTDPENKQWKSKDLYETFIAKVKPEETERNKKDLIDAYNYLAAYHASKKDCAATKACLLKVKELDPANAQAIKILSTLKC